jgi:hypothetical protein
MKPNEPHLHNLPLRIGGVMRCCIETLNTTPVTENEGDILPCKWCSSSLRVRDGAWEWNRKKQNDIWDEEEDQNETE